MSAATAQPDAGRTAGVNANAVLAIVAVAQFMVILDASIVNVALPTIKRDVGFSEQSLSWILNAYTLIFGGLPAARRPGCRPARAAPAVHGRHRAVRLRIARLRALPVRGRAARRPRVPGAGRGDGLAGRPLDHPDDVRRRTRAQSRAVGLGRDRRRRGRRRPAPRRRARAATQLALGVLRQRADRRRGAGAGAADRSRRAGRSRPRRAATTSRARSRSRSARWRWCSR